MAPGVGGNGGSNRQTGTVPKTKSHNESSREYNGTSRRDYQHFNHMPNNLSSLDWQPVNDSLPHARTRKESNTSASRFSEFDTGEENTVSQDNLWFNSAQRSQAYNSDDDEVSQASWAESGYKSNNLALPDKAQVVTRLHQIRDYVSQTESLMEGLRATGGQRNMAQHEKLAGMLEGLRDSELKLQTLYERIERLPPPPPSHTEVEPEGYPARQMLEPPRERANKPVAAQAKTSESGRKNDMKKQVQLSQLKMQELQEQQAALKALRQKAQEQLKEARDAQGALLVAQRGLNQPAAVQDNMIQDRLQNLQRFFDTRDQLVQMLSLEEAEGDSTELQNKLDELHSKKQYMDQLLAQFTNFNQIRNNNLTDDIDECENYVDNKIEELSTVSSTLAHLQANLATHVQPRPSLQERAVKKEPLPSVEKSNSVPSQAIRAKTHQLNEARAKLQQLQNLLQTIEELRESGQPIPETLLQQIGTSERSPSPVHPDRSDMSSQDLNLSQPISEQLASTGELFPERGCRSLNSCERERVNQQQPPSASKHINQGGKLSSKLQLEELMRNQDLNLPQPLQSSSFHENVPPGAWGGSSQGPLEENYNTEFQGDMNESASVKNATNSSQPHNVWRKPSTGSGTSRYSWSPYVPQESRTSHTPRPSPPTQSLPTPTPTQDIPQQPDNHWIVHQISQLQSQLQQMSGLYKNFVENQHNCAPPWHHPTNITAALGPYCQYIASTSQWQQQQLLVHSFNQCCQLIWHQQLELASLKEALSLLQHQMPEEAHFSVQQPPEDPPIPTSHSNLTRSLRPNPHVTLKPSLSAGPSLSVPAVVSSAHSLPNLTSPQTTPVSRTPPDNRNILSSPSATVFSLPPTLNNAQQHNPNLYFNNVGQFTDPNFINLYPPYGNNLNFEFPSPVNFFPNPPEPFLTWATSAQPPPATTLNNQVPPGNRANNYWDNFRSYSRQNLLSSAKSNDGLPQRTPMERFLNTDPPTQPRDQPLRSRKERLNAQSRQADNLSLSGGSVVMTRAQVHAEPVGSAGEEVELGEVAGGYQVFGVDRQQVYCPHNYQHNLCADQHSATDSKAHPAARQPIFSPHGYQHNVCNDIESRSVRLLNESDARTTRLVNDCDTLRGGNKKVFSVDVMAVNKRNYADIPAREAKISQLNNYQTDATESSTEVDLSGRTSSTPRLRRNVNTVTDNVQHNCIGDGYCLMASEQGARRKDNKGNVARECNTEVNKGADSLEECVYSEVAALISSNEWRPQFLLQLFKDLRLLSSCTDPNMQAALSSIHTLANRTVQDEREAVNEEPDQHPGPGLPPAPLTFASAVTEQPPPSNRSHKEVPQPPQLPKNCAKLDWEVRSILLEMLPFIKSQLGELCGPILLEAIRKLVLHLVPSQSTQEQLDGQLEDALHKFHGCRLGDVYEELLTVVADVLISELTFLRLVNTVNHSADQPNGEDAVVEEKEEEGAVGGVVEEEVPPSPSLVVLHPANQGRRTKSETVSEADLAEADQSRHTASGEEEERGDTAEGIDLLEDEALGQNLRSSACNGNITSESNSEGNWAVEQDREMGLDQVPTRLNNSTNPETEQEALAHSCSNPGTTDSGPI